MKEFTIGLVTALIAIFLLLLLINPFITCNNRSQIYDLKERIEQLEQTTDISKW